MRIRALWTRCDKDALRNLDWFMNTVLLPGGYTHWAAGLDSAYHFQCHPDFGRGPNSSSVRLEKDELLELSQRVKQKGIEIIPHFNLWGKFLTMTSSPYIELAENKAIPRACCPRNPKTQVLVKDMLDEIVGILRPEYFHVGLDEINENHMPYNNYKTVDQIGLCPLCRMDSPADIFAEEVNRLNKYLKEKGCMMMIWGDQLLNPPDFFEAYKREGNYGDDTHEALDKMDRDIIICDWHYGDHPSYPSIDHFVKNGFKALGCPCVYNEKNITGFTDYIRQRLPNDRLPGMVMTFWGSMSKRAETKENAQYGFIDDKVTQERLLLAGKYFQEQKK